MATFLVSGIVTAAPPSTEHIGLSGPRGLPPRERGVCLGLFSMDPKYRYHELLEEIRALGATHVTIAWVWWQDNISAVRVKPVSGWSATDEQIVDTILFAKKLGLHVTAFPIVRLIKSTATEWRGKIAPTDEDAWWSSYQRYILHSAELARRGGANRFSVGSELLSRELMRDRWLSLIDRVRLSASDLEIMYSANWDHFEPVSFWDAVDVVGVTAYWELTRNFDASTAELTKAWTGVKDSLIEWSHRMDRRFVFTEIGYPSLDGGAVWPWNETRTAKVDLEEQRRAYEAFTRAWSDTRELRGVYFWNWFGFGGPEDTNYTPRNKPAAEVLRAWYRARR